jgi:heme a synthase
VNSSKSFSPWLHAWAVFTAALTFVLLCSGGLVTSHGVGLAVPDWPNSFGYNMFAFPVSWWVQGIFFEHTHRLIATLVGLCTAILAVWMWVRETLGSVRWSGVATMVAVLVFLGVREMPVYLTLAALAPLVILGGMVGYGRGDGGLRWLGVIALAAVVLQGVLGGLRVVWLKDQIGIFHALLAQSFFVFLAILAVMSSRRFMEKRWADYEPNPALRWWALTATVLIFLQLGLGATMRHEHIGLSILPQTDAVTMLRINAERAAGHSMPTTAVQIWVQMVHRLVALLIVGAVGTLAVKARLSSRATRQGSRVWLLMICLQIGLGAWTIWSQKAADVATAHMALGALSLLLGALLTFRLFCGAKTSDFALPDVPNSRLMEGSV